MLIFFFLASYQRLLESMAIKVFRNVYLLRIDLPKRLFFLFFSVENILPGNAGYTILAPALRNLNNLFLINELFWLRPYFSLSISFSLQELLRLLELNKQEQVSEKQAFFSNLQRNWPSQQGYWLQKILELSFPNSKHRPILYL